MFFLVSILIFIPLPHYGTRSLEWVSCGVETMLPVKPKFNVIVMFPQNEKLNCKFGLILFHIDTSLSPPTVHCIWILLAWHCSSVVPAFAVSPCTDIMQRVIHWNWAPSLKPINWCHILWCTNFDTYQEWLAYSSVAYSVHRWVRWVQDSMHWQRLPMMISFDIRRLWKNFLNVKFKWLANWLPVSMVCLLFLWHLWLVESIRFLRLPFPLLEHLLDQCLDCFF